jgi:hypothetical protein
MCELEEQVFIQRCLSSQKDGLIGTAKALSAMGAKGFYDKLWGLICEWDIAIFFKGALFIEPRRRCGEAEYSA